MEDAVHRAVLLVCRDKDLPSVRGVEDLLTSMLGPKGVHVTFGPDLDEVGVRETRHIIVAIGPYWFDAKGSSPEPRTSPDGAGDLAASALSNDAHLNRPEGSLRDLDDPADPLHRALKLVLESEVSFSVIRVAGAPPVSIADMPTPLKGLLEASPAVDFRIHNASSKIFISYRKTSVKQAEAILALLKERFGDIFFMDSRDIRGGADAVRELRESLDRAAGMIVVIGDAWESAFAQKQAQGEGDWVLEEVTTILNARKNVLPVYVEREEGKLDRELPGYLDQLRAIQGVRVRNRSFLDVFRSEDPKSPLQVRNEGEFTSRVADTFGIKPLSRAGRIVRAARVPAFEIGLAALVVAICWFGLPAVLPFIDAPDQALWFLIGVPVLIGALRLLAMLLRWLWPRRRNLANDLTSGENKWLRRWIILSTIATPVGLTLMLEHRAREVAGWGDSKIRTSFEPESASQWRASGIAPWIFGDVRYLRVPADVSDDTYLLHIPTFRRVKGLDVSSATLLTGKAVGGSRFDALNWLNADGNCQVIPDALSDSICSSLEELSVSRCPVSPSAARRIAECKKLERVRLDESNLSNSDLQTLAELEMHTLSIRKCRDVTWSAISELGSLEVLDVSGAQNAFEGFDRDQPAAKVPNTIWAVGTPLSAADEIALEEAGSRVLREVTVPPTPEWRGD